MIHPTARSAWGLGFRRSRRTQLGPDWAPGTIAGWLLAPLGSRACGVAGSVIEGRPHQDVWPLDRDAQRSGSADCYPRPLSVRRKRSLREVYLLAVLKNVQCVARAPNHNRVETRPAVDYIDPVVRSQRHHIVARTQGYPVATRGRPHQVTIPPPVNVIGARTPAGWSRPRPPTTRSAPGFAQISSGPGPPRS